ncbi:MAG: hypothetical protein HC834_01680 [Rhodospirillales bacterium]|nr:hypothetical protein [Rhodospirillales bacterium]
MTFIAASTLMAAAVQPFASGHSIILGLAYLPAILYIEALSRSPRLVGIVCAKRHIISLVLICMILSIGAFLGYSQAVSSEYSQDYRLAAINFLAIGLVLGAILVRLLGDLAFQALIGKRRLGTSILAAGLWSIILVLFPWNAHFHAAPWYCTGLTVGILLDKTIRWRINKAAAAYRRLLDVADAWSPGSMANRAEMEATRLLARGRNLFTGKFGRLRKFIDECKTNADDDFSRRLALISASVYRLEGKYAEALADTEPINDTIEDDVEAHLALLRLQTKEEIGSDNEVDSDLAKLLGLPFSPGCPIAHAIYARRAAEKALRSSAKSISDIIEAEPDTEPLKYARMSERFRQKVVRDRTQIRIERTGGDFSKSLPLYIAKFSEIGIPYSSSMIIDIVGYCYLAGGMIDEARMHLARCIELDPVYSYGYLHLGDFFLFRNSLLHLKSQPTKADLWHAAACYYAARSVEINRTSRVRKLAEKRLLLIKATDRDLLVG